MRITARPLTLADPGTIRVVCRVCGHEAVTLPRYPVVCYPCLKADRGVSYLRRPLPPGLLDRVWVEHLEREAG